MKKQFILLVMACLYIAAYSQTGLLTDGIYLTDKIVTDTAQIHPLKHQRYVHFNAGFKENAPDSARGVIININSFVPLELGKEPQLTDHTDKKKKLQLAFSRAAADRLQKFTAAHLMRHVTLVINGEALTTHRIKAAITGGQIEITRCDDNACERIFVHLKNKVKK